MTTPISYTTTWDATQRRVQELGQMLLDGGLSALSERERRVVATIAEHHHVSRNINRTVEELETPGQRLADRVAQFGGSWTFILLFVAFLALWIAFNTLLITTCKAVLRRRL